MPRSTLLAAVVALVPLLMTGTSAAESIERAGDGAKPSPAPDEETTRVVAVDIDALPVGSLPPLPAEREAPTGVPAFTQPSDLKVDIVEEAPRSQKLRPAPLHGLSKVALRKKKRPGGPTQIVNVSPKAHTLDALYLPSPESLEYEASAEQRMSCGDRESVTAMRWETLRTTPDGNAALEIRDLWFAAKTCVVGPGSTKTISLRAIAWDDGKPWLFAMRGPSGVTLVMPRVNEVTSESMVGAPVSVRGDFTRITLPLGRWGSGTVVAQLDGLSTGAKTESAENGVDGPVEVGIELVQTMAERVPTLLVRTRRAPVASADARD
jgi:hypothetical protein